MSSKKTTNYKLHQWEPSDDFLRSEFNENFTKLDEAVAAEAAARAGAISSLQTALGKKPEVAVGTYTGDSTKGRAIDLGFRPRAVVVLSSDGRLNSTYGYYGGLAVTGGPVSVKDNEVIALTATGFQVSHTTASHANYTEYFTANDKSKVYHYLAVK